MNDSKKTLASRRRSHEPSVAAKNGLLEAFRHMSTDPRFNNVPMYLETEKKRASRRGRMGTKSICGSLRSMVKKDDKGGG